MARLFRPYISFAVRCRVALRQIKSLEGWAPGDDTFGADGKRLSLGRLLKARLEILAAEIGCTVKDLRLDHDPALGARPRFRRGLGKKTYYQPAANDPAHLFYRPHGTQFEGSHDVKTRIRGDHGQYSDVALIKRERRRASKKTAKVRRPKRKWGSRSLRSASRWPAGRKIQNRRKP